MKLLSIEASGMSAGCAYQEDGVLKGEYYLNNRLTHSVTLLPMIDQLKKVCGFRMEELDAIAVSAGPGSFTGLRIGAATAKGLALGLGIPIVRVSSLKGLAAGIFAPGTLICPLMDARRGEVYAAAYLCEILGGKPAWTPFLSDSAMTIETCLEEIRRITEEKKINAVFTGDGVPVQEAKIREYMGDTAFFAPTGCNRQRAGSVAILGEQEYLIGNTENPDDFVPDYYRRPLAETSKENGTLEDAGSISLKKIARGDFKRTRHPLEERETK